jgi:hypothetical protein
MYRIKNWRKFQHYSDRKPPWIKLHLSLMHEIKYLALTDKAKITLVHCWMAAAELWKPDKEPEPLLPSDTKLLKSLLKLEGNLRINELKLSGYLIHVPSENKDLQPDVSSTPLAKCSTETEVEVEQPKTKAAPGGAPNELLPVVDKLMAKVQDRFKGFNPYAFMTKHTNRQRRPLEVWVDMWERMLREANDIQDPWAWCETVYSQEAQNTEARMHEAEHEQRNKDFSDAGSILGNLMAKGGE